MRGLNFGTSISVIVIVLFMQIERIVFCDLLRVDDCAGY